ncbi:MAG: hypothetical protein WCI71_17880 [Bacteroidota bacterium]
MKTKARILVGFITLIVMLLGFIFVYGQTKDEPSPKNIYVYAEAMIRWNGFGKWMTTEVDFGTNVNVVDVNREEIENKVNIFKNGVDIMNYLSAQGWEMASRDETRLGNTSWVTYTFRKLK